MKTDNAHWQIFWTDTKFCECVAFQGNTFMQHNLNVKEIQLEQTQFPLFRKITTYSKKKKKEKKEQTLINVKSNMWLLTWNRR